MIAATVHSLLPGEHMVMLATAGGSTINVGGDWGFVVQIVQFGVIGLMLIMLLLRKFVVPEWTLRDAEARHDREMAAKDVEIKELKESNSALRTLTEQQIIPALVRANQLSADYAADLAAERRRRHGSQD